jgi:LPXTG-motif cell wall-anchored protein
VCEPTGGGQLPATGSSAIPLFVAVVALFAGGLSVLLATRIRPVD